MSNDFSRESMLDIFIFETLQLIEQLEQSILDSEKESGLESSINEIFRIMHTIKGSAAMMLYNNISSLAHSVEDVFFYLRENKVASVDYSGLTDIVLEGVDFIKSEIAKIQDGKEADGNADGLVAVIKEFLSSLKSSGTPDQEKTDKKPETSSESDGQKYYISPVKPADAAGNVYEAVIFFEDGCEMENIRAFTVTHNLKNIAADISYIPVDIMDNDETVEIIRKEGFRVMFSSDSGLEEVRAHLLQTMFLKHLELEHVKDCEAREDKPSKTKQIILDDNAAVDKVQKSTETVHQKDNASTAAKVGMISVNIAKLDKLMDLVGELVISEAMVTQNPELNGLQLDGFNKAARQLKKITNELQDTVMSIRMVPLSTTFQKMNRIVRDMSKKLNKNVELEILGAETEVDKNIIERISDPLMHLIRNALDHGIEPVEERVAQGKPETGKVVLEAKNAGGDVWIIIKDDGKGMDREKILKKAREHGLVYKSEAELTDREVYSFIMLPGFSTKESVTEFSGRGVGMDVVSKNIESIGGTVIIDSIQGEGTTMSIKIPLTLAIIDGMIIRVGDATYTIPTISIKESFRAREDDIITDPDKNEMILIRGECHPIMRLCELYSIKTGLENIHEGIIIMVENEQKSLCIFADELLGEQQVVVKALPKYLSKVRGVAGCTLLGDGSISLILDIAGLINI